MIRALIVGVVALITTMDQAICDETVLLPIAPNEPVAWRFTTDRPAKSWFESEFDDRAWKSGPAGFGTEGTPETTVGTVWKTPEIWLRREFNYDGQAFEKAALWLYHDEDVRIFLNGQLVLERAWYVPRYELYDVSARLKQTLRTGRNVLAVTCRQTDGGQYVDVGVVLDPKRDMLRALVLPPLKPLFDHPVRDTSICLGPDGCYYLTGTTGNNSGGPRDPKSWWHVNEGIRMWRSPDLKEWSPMGLVWKIEQGTWQKEFHEGRRALWAPDVHFLKGTFWLTYSMNFRGTGLLKSVSGKADGPYVDVHPAGPIAGKIDASLFQDDDGKVYFVWQNGLIARLNDEMNSLAEEPRLLRPSNHHQVGFEGAFVTKRRGKYFLICADFIHGDYHCMVAQSDQLFGPYGPRYLAIPHGGHNMFFEDKEGRWWATFFGNDPRAPIRERPAILPIRLDDNGRVTCMSASD